MNTQMFKILERVALIENELKTLKEELKELNVNNSPAPATSVDQAKVNDGNAQNVYRHIDPERSYREPATNCTKCVNCRYSQQAYDAWWCYAVPEPFKVSVNGGCDAGKK